MSERTPKGGGDCFVAAVNLLLNLHHRGEVAGWRLCQAMVTGQGPVEGYRFAHAFLWHKEEAIVIDTSNGKQPHPFPDQLYFKKGRIDLDGVFVSYEFPEAIAAMVKHEHYGPWPTDALPMRKWKTTKPKRTNADSILHQRRVRHS